jgi:hypothetical protein
LRTLILKGTVENKGAKLRTEDLRPGETLRQLASQDVAHVFNFKKLPSLN